MCNLLLPTTEACQTITSQDLMTKDYIIWVEYEGRHQTNVTVYMYISYILEEYLLFNIVCSFFLDHMHWYGINK